MPTGNSPESQNMTDDERATIRAWVEAGAPLGVQVESAQGGSKAERLEAGKRLFTTICAACHQVTGQGIPSRFPPLAGSDFLNADKHRAIKIVLNGLQGQIVVNGRTFNNSMPKLPLSDGDIAAALTYVYGSFGNSGRDVLAEEVAVARNEPADFNTGTPTQSVKSSPEPSPFE